MLAIGGGNFAMDFRQRQLWTSTLDRNLVAGRVGFLVVRDFHETCLLYTSDAADE